MNSVDSSSRRAMVCQECGHRGATTDPQIATDLVAMHNEQVHGGAAIATVEEVNDVE